MSQQVPSPSKGVKRSVAIALGMVCIILVVVSLVGALIINDENNTISSLNYQIDSLNSIIRRQNNTISSLNTQLATLQQQVSNIHILGTENSTVWVDNQTVHVTQGTSWEFDNVSSPGYVSFLVSSSSNSTYAEILIPAPANGTIAYDQKIHVGFEGTAIFPIPPSPHVYVEVGNTVVGQGTITVTITYYY